MLDGASQSKSFATAIETKVCLNDTISVLFGLKVELWKELEFAIFSIVFDAVFVNVNIPQ